MVNDAELEEKNATFPTGDRISLSRLRCNVVSEMLGVWLAPNGDHTTIVAQFKESAIEWGAKVRPGNSSHNEVR